MTTKIEIKSRITGGVLFHTTATDLRAAVVEAVASRADLTRANLTGAFLTGANLLIIGPIGSRADTLYVTGHGADIRVRTGCFEGTLVEFAAAAEETHGASQYGDEYRAAIALARARLFKEDAS